MPHPFLQVWDLLQEGKADATWVFMGWEGVEARLKGVELNAFHLQARSSRRAACGLFFRLGGRLFFSWATVLFMIPGVGGRRNPTYSAA